MAIAFGADPQARRWTRDEYIRAYEAGVFRPSEKLELLEGEILRKLSPQTAVHASAVVRSAEALRRAFGEGYHVREEKPLVLADSSEPEPDIVVVRGSSSDFADHHPTAADAAVVMEVAETSLAFDQGRKAAAYARAGIQEYWLLDGRNRRLEVRRNPGAAGEDQYEYRLLLVVLAEGSVSPLAAPHAEIPVSDLLPARRPRRP